MASRQATEAARRRVCAPRARRLAVLLAVSLAAILVSDGVEAGAPPGPVRAACRLHGAVVPRPGCLPASRLVLRVGERTLRPAWIGRLSSARFAGWEQRQVLPGGVRFVRVPGSRGRHVARFLVRPGDQPVPGGERAEVAASQAATGGGEGREAWYAWSTYLPADLAPLPSHTWNVFTQFHQTGRDHCSPNVALQINTRARPARIRLAVRGGTLDVATCRPGGHAAWDTVRAVRRRWYDFVLHVRWSADPQRGLVELFVNGRRVVAPARLATLYRGQGVYAKQGFYRGPSPRPSRIVHAGMTRFE